MVLDVIRAMTPAELDCWCTRRRWPCCGGTDYQKGPRGGLSINLRCPACGMEINVMDPESHWAHAGVLFGQVLREPPGYVPPGQEAGPSPPLRIWTVYKHPKDFPGHYVARCWSGDEPSDCVLLGRELDDVRSLLPEGLYRMDRKPNDDPCIVETWF